MTTTALETISQTQAEAQIRHLIDDHISAICAKNLDQIMAHYAPEIVIFDMKPPLALRGIDDCHTMWATSLPYMPTISGMETQSVSITISNDLALAHWVARFAGLEPNHPAAQMWLRITSGCQRQGEQWQIIHEHVSVPFAHSNSADCTNA
ncbi:MAG: nuclear transport factor 2 family protein [Tildeniella torsiva UHER 1998/13D]|jgi:ketosteroid isomerase-like protein|nr:nuclear transport factor 2 family protein [Tildeniella torsiva UHER 1998/13D]